MLQNKYIRTLLISVGKHPQDDIFSAIDNNEIY